MSRYLEFKNNVIVRKDSLELLKKADSLVLDIDGVIVDVSASFRIAISRTVQYFLTEILDFTSDEILLAPDETQLFKLAGGFNNDWELTYAAVLFFLGQSVLSSTKDTTQLKQESNLVQFTEAVKGGGGGVNAAQRIVYADLDEEQKKQVEKKWDKDLIKQIFQEFYAGTDYCEKLYGFSPTHIKRRGLLGDEKVILDRNYLKLFLPKVAILTGRTKEEAAVALKRAGLENLIDPNLILADDGSIRKPDPKTLDLLGEQMKTQTGLYIGDVIDDLKTVINFKELDNKMQFAAGIVCQKREEKNYKDLGADIVGNETDNLLATISEIKKED